MPKGKGLAEEVLPQLGLGWAGVLVGCFSVMRVGIARILGWLRIGAWTVLLSAEKAGVGEGWIEKIVQKRWYYGKVALACSLLQEHRFFLVPGLL